MEGFTYNIHNHSPCVTHQMLSLSSKIRYEDSVPSHVGLAVGQKTWHQTCFMHDAFFAKATSPSNVFLVGQACLPLSVEDLSTGYNRGRRMVSARILNILEQPIINKADNPPPKPKGDGPKGPPQPRDGAGNRSADKKKPLGNLGFSVIGLLVGFSGAVKASPGKSPESYI